MKDLHLTMQIRNNLLRRRRVDRGLNSAELCRRVGILLTDYCELEKMRKPPMYTRRRGMVGQWRPIVLKLAEFYGCEPAALFPADILCVEKSTFEKEMDVSEVVHLLPSPESQNPERLLRLEGVARLRDDEVAEALDHLSHRERTVIEKRFGFNGKDPQTLDSVAKDEGVSRERLRQIELNGLRKLRRPHISVRLRELIEP